MATRISQIRILPDSSRSSREKPFNQPSSPSKQTKTTMFMAQAPTQSQQARPCRPHHRPYHAQNIFRPRPGGARAVPPSPCADNHQNWHRRDETNMMKALPPRGPLQEVDLNARCATLTPRGPRQQRVSVEKVQMPPPPAHSRMSEMHSLIDDYLAWNKSASDLEDVRPGSAGTLFVDFASNGDMEVSYRNGVNKKLPVPPLPSKTLWPSNAASWCRDEAAGKDNVRPSIQRKHDTHSRPLPPRPNISFRHDSAVDCDPKYAEQVHAYASRPLPRLPSQLPKHNHPQGRKTYPPQVHRTRQSASQTALAPLISPATSHSSLSTYHTAPSSRNGSGGAEREAFSMIEPGGLTVHYQPSFRGSTTSRRTGGVGRGYVCGHDAATAYDYDYDGRTVHVHREPSSSRPGSWTSEYFDIAASTYAASPDLNLSQVPSSNVMGGHGRAASTRSSAATQRAKTSTSRKPLPPLPPAYPSQKGYERLPEPPRADAKKRRKVFTFVQKVLRKLDDLGVMKELSGRRQR
ncbi:hypothetical protein SVAN01_02950 [Stagonosporopsis vannaccii]|nr:hypothetical protein SVAN01_02950 [Stagonosporopsis vannaccii]